MRMLASGLSYEFGSLEESLTSLALNKESEIEYLKVVTIVNAIISTGNAIRASITGSDSSGSDSMKETLEELRDIMLPHLAENREEKAKQVKERLAEEHQKGPLQIKVMEDNRKRRRRS